MGKLPAMKATVNADTKSRRISVVIEHDPRQSYTRAVGPMATKEFKSWVRQNIVFGSLNREAAHIDAGYVRDSKDRCLTLYSFTY